MSDSALLDFGDLDLEVDTSAADARQARIALAREQAKAYSVKVENERWFQDPVEIARMKDPTRPALFSLHHLYYSRQWLDAVENGLDLIEVGLKEESEVMDLVMRAWIKGEGSDEAVKRKVHDVVRIAQRWREFPNQPSICHVSAQILSLASSSRSPSRSPSASDADLVRTALSASLASLRLNRTQPPFLSTLSDILSRLDPVLATALDSRSAPTSDERIRIDESIARFELDDAERDTLERVLGLHGDEHEVEEEAVRSVRNL
ncbi:hypothetical protein JCM10212_000619 [Sporobolomyces blumeae]